MKSIKSYIITGIVFVSVLGTLFHFVYNLSGNNFFVELFTPVNESIWEHTKLIYFPMMIYLLYGRRKIKLQYPGIDSATIFGAISGVLLIIVLYYTYTGIIGFNIAPADISIFYISVLAAFYAVYKMTVFDKTDMYALIFKILNLLMIILYIIFTIYPPEIPLFVSP